MVDQMIVQEAREAPQVRFRPPIRSLRSNAFVDHERLEEESNFFNDIKVLKASSDLVDLRSRIQVIACGICLLVTGIVYMSIDKDKHGQAYLHKIAVDHRLSL